MGQAGEGEEKEKHDDNLQLPVAFPGSPGGQGGAGGGGLFSITGAPFVDAALTTLIGLSIGMYHAHSELYVRI